MNCERIEREEIIERYLTGRLDRAEQEAFEAHYFSCHKCLEKLEVSRRLQEKLWTEGDKTLPPTAAPRRVGIKRRAWAYSVAAVLFIVAAAALWWQLIGPGRPPAGTKETYSSLTMLARIEPPLYIPSALRGMEDEAAERFRLGMKSYVEGRYGEAIPDLRSASELNPEGAGIRFFLGICLLLIEQTDEGIAELGKTIALGDSPYLEEAHFYLAKAYLGKGDVRAAKKELNWVLERGINLKEEAARISDQLR
jgi:tetratricopeptide (TPR) repeat protein